MSLSVANVGGTMTGGSSVNLSFAGNANGSKVSYVTPSHTRLAPRQVDLTVTPAKTTAQDPGVARSTMKITFGDRIMSETTDSVKQGNVIVDVGLRWSLNQPETLVDDALDYLRSLVFNAAFEDALKKGILPTT